METKKIKNKIRDQFEVSDGNLEVLSAIPRMMKIKKYRTELRKLAIDFMMEDRQKYLESYKRK